MATLALAITCWLLVSGAGLFGMWLGPRLPDKHRTSETQTAVSVSMAMVSTLTAMVLGLVLSVAHSSFRNSQEQVMSTASDIIRLDHLFRLYGHDADHARDTLHQYSISMMQDLFPEKGDASNVEDEDTLDIMARTEDASATLSPATPTQRWLQPRIVEVADTIVQEHYSLVKQQLDRIPTALIGLLLLWLIVLFAVHGLYTPHHITSLLVLMISSGAASGAIFLIAELETPSSGFIQLSAEPLQHAIDFMEAHNAK